MIGLQWNVENVDVQLEVLELILIPVDEWAGDIMNPKAAIGSTAYATASVTPGMFLDIDSCSNPKHDIVALARESNGGNVVTRYDVVANGPLIIQPSRAQKIWFLSMGYNLSPSAYWTSERDAAATVVLNHTPRYSGLRGSN